jgi:hypothetical protein
MRTGMFGKSLANGLGATLVTNRVTKRRSQDAHRRTSRLPHSSPNRLPHATP